MKIPNKFIIISDIHTNYINAETIIEKEKPDQTIFLGDYFDSLDETDETVNQTAKWLANSLAKEDRIHLIGNHDLSYMTKLPYLRSSGYSEYKQHIIDKHNIPWEKLMPYYFVGDWLFTHAGVSKQFFEKYATTNLYLFMTETAEDIKHINDPIYHHKFFRAGESRGGPAEHGGILWCDYDEFVDIKGQKQVFGHTQGDYVRTNGYHICLDTRGRHYAVYEDNKMVIKEVKKCFH